MLDYNYVMVARQEHERRIQELIRFRAAQDRSPAKLGPVDRLIYRSGEFLEAWGAQLKARHAAAPLRQSYQSGHAA